MNKANKLTILIDMDDTIENLLEVWVSELNRIYGTHVTLDMIHTWNVGSYFPELSTEQVFEILNDATFWEKLQPLPGAVDSISRLIADQHDVFIVTASHRNTIKAKLDGCLFKWFPFISPDHVIIASHKQMIHGDVLIDDAPHNLIGGDYAKILVTAPHNRGFDAESNGMIRCDSWDEIYGEVQKIVNNKEV